MANVEKIEEENQKAQDYLEAYHLLIRGMDLIGAFMHATNKARKSTAGKQLERAYVLLRRDFLSMYDKHPELGDKKTSVLNVIPRLGGAYTPEYITEWAEGCMEPDEYGNLPPYRYGGNHSYEDELATISEKAYLVGIEDIEKKPKNMQYQESYSLAQDAIRDIKAADIDEYTLTWDEDNGRVLLNGVCVLSHTYLESGSSTTAFMQEIKKQQDEGKNNFSFTFSPSGSRSTAQTISDLGINPLLRDIFFLKDTKGNYVHFRSPVKREKLLLEGVDTNKLCEQVDLRIVESKL